MAARRHSQSGIADFLNNKENDESNISSRSKRADDRRKTIDVSKHPSKKDMSDNFSLVKESSLQVLAKDISLSLPMPSPIDDLKFKSRASKTPKSTGSRVKSSRKSNDFLSSFNSPGLSVNSFNDNNADSNNFSNNISPKDRRKTLENGNSALYELLNGLEDDSNCDSIAFANNSRLSDISTHSRRGGERRMTADPNDIENMMKDLVDDDDDDKANESSIISSYSQRNQTPGSILNSFSSPNLHLSTPLESLCLDSSSAAYMSDAKSVKGSSNKGRRETLENGTTVLNQLLDDIDQSCDVDNIENESSSNCLHISTFSSEDVMFDENCDIHRHTADPDTIFSTMKQLEADDLSETANKSSLSVVDESIVHADIEDVVDRNSMKSPEDLLTFSYFSDNSVDTSRNNDRRNTADPLVMEALMLELHDDLDDNSKLSVNNSCITSNEKLKIAAEEVSSAVSTPQKSKEAEKVRNSSLSKQRFASSRNNFQSIESTPSKIIESPSNRRSPRFLRNPSPAMFALSSPLPIAASSTSKISRKKTPVPLRSSKVDHIDDVIASDDISLSEKIYGDYSEDTGMLNVNATPSGRNYTPNTERRLTADASDMAALMQDLMAMKDEEEVRVEDNKEMSCNDEFLSVDRKDIHRRDSIDSNISELTCNYSVDLNDNVALLERNNDRRLTADAADIASLMNAIENMDDEVANNATGEINMSDNFANYHSVSNANRDSIDTVDLMHSVKDILTAVDEDNNKTAEKFVSTYGIQAEQEEDEQTCASIESIDTFALISSVNDALVPKIQFNDSILDDSIMNDSRRSSVESTDSSFASYNSLNDIFNNILTEAEANADLPADTSIISATSSEKKQKSKKEKKVKKTASFDFKLSSPKNNSKMLTSPDTSTGVKNDDDNDDNRSNNESQISDRSKRKRAKSGSSPGATPAARRNRVSASALSKMNKSSSISNNDSLVLSPLVTNRPSIGGGLKSCLSKQKSSKKSVIFGSPNAVEFDRNAPTTSFTPMPREEARVMFPVADNSLIAASIDGNNGDNDEDEEDDFVTEENSRILDEWDRLTNTSGGEESDEEFPLSGNSNASGSSNPSPRSTPMSLLSESVTSKLSSGSASSRRRRRSMLHLITPPDFNKALQEEGEELEELETSVNDDSLYSEPTGTVELPKTLTDLLNEDSLKPKKISESNNNNNDNKFVKGPFGKSIYENNKTSSTQSVNTSTLSMDSHTQALEFDLQTLIENVGVSYVNIPSSNENSAREEDEEDSYFNISQSSKSTKTSSENSLGALVGDVDTSNISSSVLTEKSLSDTAGEGRKSSTADNEESSMFHSNNNDSFALADEEDEKNDDGDDDGFTQPLEGKLADLVETITLPKDKVLNNNRFRKSPKQREQDEPSSSNLSISEDHTRPLELNLDIMMNEFVAKDNKVMKNKKRITIGGGSKSGGANISMNSDILFIDDDSGLLDENSLLSDENTEPLVEVNEEHDENTSICKNPDFSVSYVSDDFKNKTDIIDVNVNVNDIADTIALDENKSSAPATVVTNTIAAVNTSAIVDKQLLTRLKGLNASSHRKSLAQCKTPLGISSRLSIGIKRQSMEKEITRQNKNILKSTAKNASNIASIEEDNEVNVDVIERGGDEAVSKRVCLESDNILKMQSAVITPLNELLHKALFNNSIEDGEEKHSSAFLATCKAALESTATSKRTTQLLENSLHTIFTAASEECTSELDQALAREESLYSAWSNISSSAQDLAAEVVQQSSLSSGSSASELSLKAAVTQSRLAVNNQWQKWESRLLSIGAESLLSSIEIMKDTLAALRQERIIAKEDRMKVVHANNSKFSAKDAATSALECRLSMLREQARDARIRLESSKDESLSLGEETSQLLAEITRKTQMKVSSSDENNSISTLQSSNTLANKEYEDLSKELKNLQLTIGVLNRLSWCKLTEFTTSAIRVSLLLSETTSIDISFHLQQYTNDNNKSKLIRVSSIEHHIIQNEKKNGTAAKKRTAFSNASSDSVNVNISMLTKHYYQHILCGISGPLHANYSNKIKSLSDIQRCMKRLSGFCSPLRTMLTDLNDIASIGWKWELSNNITITNSINATANANANASGKEESSSNIMFRFVCPDSQHVMQLPMKTFLNGTINGVKHDNSDNFLYKLDGKQIESHVLQGLQQMLSSISIRYNNSKNSTLSAGRLPYISLLKATEILIGIKNKTLP